MTVGTLLAELGFDATTDVDETIRWALIELKLRREEAEQLRQAAIDDYFGDDSSLGYDPYLGHR